MIAPWLIPDPALNFHSSSPVLASSALNQPWMLPWKTSPPPVAQGAAHEGQLLFAAPDLLLIDRVPGHHFAHEAAWTRLVEIELFGEIERALLHFLLFADEIHTEIEGRDVDKTGLRAIGHRLPVLASEQVRADVLCPHFEPRPLFRGLRLAARSRGQSLWPS